MSCKTPIPFNNFVMIATFLSYLTSEASSSPFIVHDHQHRRPQFHRLGSVFWVDGLRCFPGRLYSSLWLGGWLSKLQWVVLWGDVDSKVASPPIFFHFHTSFSSGKREKTVIIQFTKNKKIKSMKFIFSYVQKYKIKHKQSKE